MSILVVESAVWFIDDVVDRQAKHYFRLPIALLFEEAFHLERGKLDYALCWLKERSN